MSDFDDEPNFDYEPGSDSVGEVTEESYGTYCAERWANSKNTPQRSAAFLAGNGRAVLPKKDLYLSELDFLRLKIAVDHGYLSWEAYQDAREKETNKFYQEVLGCVRK